MPVTFYHTFEKISTRKSPSTYRIHDLFMKLFPLILLFWATTAASSHYDDTCMSITQLHGVVQLASWNRTVGSKPRSAVMLTTCDLKCLKSLFEPFIWALENSRDGDLSQHLIIV